MKFRLTAFTLHLSGSALALALVLGALWLGWYRWPGWYLTGVLKIAAMMVGIDVVLGPLLTLVIANPKKPRRELARDIGLIVAVQVAALVYGTSTLWQGRPLYYAFSVNVLQLVQASDLDATEIKRGQQENPALAPHWYSRPRWVWAPLPKDEKEQEAIVSSAVTGGTDVIQMPRYFKTWQEGKPELRHQLKSIDELGQFGSRDKEGLKRQLLQRGEAVGQKSVIPFTGRGKPLLCVFDPNTMRIRSIIRAD